MTRRMDEQEFRQIIAAELNHLQPPDALWNKIEKRGFIMQQPSKRRWMTSIGIAAAAALVIFAAAPTLLNQMGSRLPGSEPLPPAVGEPSGSQLAMFLRMSDQYYWNSYESIAHSELGAVLMKVQRHVTEADTPHENGDSNMPQPGADVREITGVDPAKSVAVQMSESLWHVFDAGPGPVGFQGSGVPAEQGVVTSDNFQVMPPRITDAGRTNLQLEGKVRAPGGRFKAEVWSGAQKIAEEWVMVEGEASAFVSFSWGMWIQTGIPDGAEVRYLVPIAKDGPLDMELTLPVQ